MVDESSGEEWRQNGEIQSECSSADTEDRYEFLTTNYNADFGSDAESAESYHGINWVGTCAGVSKPEPPPTAGKCAGVSKPEPPPTTTTTTNTADIIHTCNVCLKPEWRRSNNPKQRYCRDHCIHSLIASCCDPHQDAPMLKTEPGPMPGTSCSPLLPPDIEEILKSSTKLVGVE